MNKELCIRKGQLEMMGLIVLVIIVITVMLIYMVYKVNNPEADVREGFVDDNLATNFLISVMKVNIEECIQHSLGDLIVDCAGDIKRIRCGGRLSCDVAKDKTSVLLAKSMEYVSRNYSYSVDNTDIEYDGCKGKDRIAQAIQYFTVYPSMKQISIRLDVCPLI